MRKSKFFIFSILSFVLLSYFNPCFYINQEFEHNRNIGLSSEEKDSWATIIHENELEYSKFKVVNNCIYVVGYLRGDGLYITKYNSSGVKLWEYGWNGYVWHFDFTIDSDDYLFIAGTLFTEPSDELFLLKINPSGHLVWLKVIKSDISCWLFSLKLDLNNNLYFSCYDDGSTGSKINLIKLNSSGDILWNRDLNMGEPDRIEMHIDSGNNIILYGGTDYSRQYLIKYNSSGSIIWEKEWGEDFMSGKCHMTGKCKVTSNDNILISNITYHRSNNSVDVWIMKINGSGITINNTKIMNCWISEQAYWGEFWYYDEFNNIYFMRNIYGDGLVLYKINSNLTIAWNCSLNYSVSPYGSYSMKCDSQQDIIIIFGIYIYPLSSKILLFKLNSSGTIIDNFSWGGPNRDRIEQVFIDAQDDLYFLCISEHINRWYETRFYNVLVKNPKANGIPPELNLVFNENDTFIFTIMGFASLISLGIALSIIIPELIHKRYRNKSN